MADVGDLSQAQGGAMVALCHDTITLLTKLVRANEVPLRATACTALAASLIGSGGVGKAAVDEAIKNLKHVMGERGAPVELRCAVLHACPPLVAYCEQLWAGDLVEQTAALIIKAMDDPAAAVRHTASDALGTCLVAALSHPFVTAAALAAAKDKGKKKGRPPKAPMCRRRPASPPGLLLRPPLTRPPMRASQAASAASPLARRMRPTRPSKPCAPC